MAEPVMPFVAKEYAIWPGIPGSSPPLDHRWGCLFCEDQAGNRWTVLGDYDFVVAMRAVGGSRDPGNPLGVSGEGGPMMDEFPMDRFAPKWAVAGWSDEWAGAEAIEAFDLTGEEE